MPLQNSIVQHWSNLREIILMVLINHLRIYLFAGLLLAACAGTEVKTSSENKPLMVSGKIETSESYCGGAAPPEELLQELQRKKPNSGYKLYIKEGKVNDLKAPIIDSVLTNKDGEFMFNLLPGEYVLLSSNHLNRAVFTRFQDDKYIRINDMDCLETWWQNGMAKLKLDNQPTDTIYFHLKKECFLPLGIPCLAYNGPVPP